jgi:hypothetical protein
VAREEIPQDELLRVSEEQLEKVNAEARRLAGDLSIAQLRWVPPDGGWSVAQVFAHLATANGSYLEPLQRAIERDAASGAGPEHRTWRPSFFGGMLIRSLEPSAKRGMPSPKIWRPSGEQPTVSLQAFLDSQASILHLARVARGVDLVRARLSSPVSRLIRLNVGDIFRIFVVHDWRHLGQVQRVIAREGFPAG